MKITFNIHYHTQWGQQLVLTSSATGTHSKAQTKVLPMNYLPGGHWNVTLDLSKQVSKLSYRYALQNDSGTIIGEEWHHDRVLDCSKIKETAIDIHDSWRPLHHPENCLDNSAFLEVIFKGKKFAATTSRKKDNSPRMQFQILAPRLGPNQQICIVGNAPELGNWNPDQAILLGNKAYPLWSVRIPAPQISRIEYKYGVFDTSSKEIVLETGPNRILKSDLALRKPLTIKSDLFFEHPDGLWKGTGLSIPVFSLRTEKSFGVGSFSDICLLVDWAKTLGMKMVQILPINDTSATGTWVDSYPYAAISVFALHPLYLDLEKLPDFEEIIDRSVFEEKQKELNALDKIDYELVIQWKLGYAKQIFKHRKEAFLKDPKFKKFLKNNQHWLKPYALFCSLRDQYGTVDFNQWGSESVYSDKQLKRATRSNSTLFDEIAFNYYLQFHLDSQLFEVAQYARKNQLVLKGDIPIGIYRYSVDAWTQPHLYHMDSQSGAPPDPFSDLGQNWGFPTYNWPEMAKNGYKWWQNRLQTLSRYFDAFRIDHILGFFRIWQIPYEQIQGTLGYFNPAIPVNRSAFEQRGIGFDYDRFCRPYITQVILEDLFGKESKQVIDIFLEPLEGERFQFKPAFNTQRKVRDFLREKTNKQLADWKDDLFQLHSNVLLLEDPGSDQQAFHPRIDLQKTTSYAHLDGPTRYLLDDLYNDYFYHRQEEFWREQGMTKLPAIKKATHMLICGEDLGMIPACVPEVMRELDLLTLEIQRMSKNPQTEFLQAADVPYFSVASPSTHDMSPIRAWWEEMDPDQRSRFFHQELGQHGEPPASCEPDVVERIILQHLRLPSLWVVFPIQELLGLSERLRYPKPLEERINVPANPQHYWQYRLHLNLEDLMAAADFNAYLRGLLEDTGRA